MVRRWTAGVAALALAGLLAACGGQGSGGGPGGLGPLPSGGSGAKAGGGKTSKPAARKPEVRQVPVVPGTPHYDALKVGDVPYVNACQAYSKGNVAAAFDRYMPTNAVIQVQYAENPLPASWYTKPDDKATSECTVEFADSPWDDATIIFGIDQYASPTLASAAFQAYKPQSQAALDKTNAKWGTHLHVSADNTTAVSGLANTYYQPTSGASWTLAGSRIVTFNGGTVVSRGRYLAALRNAVPRAVAAIQRPGLQAEHGSQEWGRRIGAARYVNPCTAFTADLFRKASGVVSDPTQVNLTYNTSAVSHPRAVEPDGIAHNSCDRRSLIPGKYVDLEVEIAYFASSAQARTQTGILRRKHHTTPVSGMGPGAFIYSYAGIPSLTVVHGPYALTVTGSTVTNGKRVQGPLSMLKTAARTTAARLDR